MKLTANFLFFSLPAFPPRTWSGCENYGGGVTNRMGDPANMRWSWKSIEMRKMQFPQRRSEIFTTSESDWRENSAIYYESIFRLPMQDSK